MTRTLPLRTDDIIITGRLDPLSPRVTLLITPLRELAEHFCLAFSACYRTGSYEMWDAGEYECRWVRGADPLVAPILSSDNISEIISCYLTKQIESINDVLDHDTWWGPDVPAALIARSGKGAEQFARQHHMDTMSDRDRRLKKAGVPWFPMNEDRPLHDHTASHARRRQNSL